MLLSTYAIGFAQLVNIESTEKVNLPENSKVYKSQLSPDGSYLLLTDLNKEGLQKFDLQSGKFTWITTAQGAGYDAKISADGQTIVYRQTSYGSDKLKRTALKSINLESGEEVTLVQPTRNLQGVALSATGVTAIDNGKVKVKQLGKEKASKQTVAFVKYGQLMISKNGKTSTLSPNGTSGQSYLWPSVSPDGTKVVYYLATKGAYVCNIDGTGVQSLGVVRAPKWYSNDVVVGMHDVDNGEFVTSSEIIAVSTDGTQRQTLTADNVIGMYPSVSTDGGKISFSTPAGEVYIINVKR